jgi:hypothetical protein
MAFTLIGEKEQNRFHHIEELLGKPVEKAPIPKELGPVPSYHPRSHSRPKGKGGRHFHHKNAQNHSKKRN